MNVEWDPVKAKINLSKHGIAFTDVDSVFYDQFALSMPDTFAIEEERFVVVGRDALSRIVFVSYTYRDDGIRIISARRATQRERNEYEKGIQL